LDGDAVLGEGVEVGSFEDGVHGLAGFGPAGGPDAPDGGFQFGAGHRAPPQAHRDRRYPHLRHLGAGRGAGTSGAGGARTFASAATPGTSGRPAMRARAAAMRSSTSAWVM